MDKNGARVVSPEVMHISSASGVVVPASVCLACACPDYPGQPSIPSAGGAPHGLRVGEVRYELGEERAARPHLEAYVALRPDDAAAFFRLGASLLSIAKTPQGSPPPYVTSQRDAEQAAAAFGKCYALKPRDEDAALAMSAAWLRAAELAELQSKPAERDALRARAVEHLNGLAATFPGNAEVHFRLGVLATMQQDAKAARAAYVAALARDEGHVGSLMNLAALVAAAGEVDQAKAFYARLLAAPGASIELSRRERERIEKWLLEISKPTGEAGAEEGRCGVCCLAVPAWQAPGSHRGRCAR